MNKGTGRQNSRLTALVPLLMFAVLAVSVLTVLMTGAEGYGRLTERDNESYITRTAEQYLRTRLRQASGEVTVTSFEGCPAVTFREQIGDFACITRIYCYDGYLRELFSLEEEELLPEAGEKVLEMQDMRVTAAGSLLYIELTDTDGETYTSLHHRETGRYDDEK